MSETVQPFTGNASRFPICLAETLKWEGSWSNDKYDSGGATMRGVIQRVYDAYRTRHGLPRRSVRLIEESELQSIYRANYWAEVKGDSLPAGLDLAVFDFGVNSGPFRSIIKLQGVLGVAQDGQFGPVTQAAIDEADVAATVKALQKSRRQFVRQIRVYWRFGKGWERRINGVEVAALAMVGTAPETPTEIPVPKADAEAQSVSQGRAAPDQPPKINAKAAAAVAAPVAGSVGGAIATPTPDPAAVPLPPAQINEAVGAWHSFSGGVKDFGLMAFEHWPFVLAAIGIWWAASYGVPWAYRRFAT